MSLCYLSFRVAPADTVRPARYRTARKLAISGWDQRAASPTLPSFPHATRLRCPPDLPATYSALVEPFAVGLHGVHSAEVASGDEVVIVGAGGVGLTTLVWALAKGAVRVTVADPDLRRREFAGCDRRH